MSRKYLSMLVCGWTLGIAAQITARTAELFTPTTINTARSEATAIADINRDGKLDIIAGNIWYEAPSWKQHQFRTLGGGIDSAGNGFLNSDYDVPLDVDGDGWMDIVSGFIYDGLAWYRNPGLGTAQWIRTQIDGGEHHSGDLWDIDGDGKSLELLAGKDTTRWYEIGLLTSGKPGLIRHDISPKVQQYGGGVGDLNGDGRPDIIRPSAWFEAPANPRTGVWKEHCLALGFRQGFGQVFAHESGCGMTEHTQQIWVMDVDKDGLNDIITGGAHTYGLFWYKQAKDGGGNSTFKLNIIDSVWSQVHAITLSDVDKDGDMDILTGKRWRAHGLGDPGGAEPAGVYWYELQSAAPVKWVKHVLSFNAGISAGMNLAVADMDKDGDVDFAVTSKAGGPYLFTNQLNPVSGLISPMLPPGTIAPRQVKKSKRSMLVLRIDGQGVKMVSGVEEAEGDAFSRQVTRSVLGILAPNQSLRSH